MDKKIVIPGELISDNPSLSGAGTYVSGGKVYASVCGLLTQKGKLSVHPFSGPYMPKKNDYILGYVTVVTSSNWIFDIGCPYEGLLHVSEYPIRVPSEEMGKHFDVGDTVLVKVTDVNAEMKIELTYKDPVCRKLVIGRLFEVPSSKVSRIIGGSGAMISMLKAKTGCDIFVGGNGRIWMNGASEDMDILTRALQKIEKDAHLSGLTDLIIAFIQEQYDFVGLKPHDFVPPKEPAASPDAADAAKKPRAKKARSGTVKKSAEDKETTSDAAEAETAAAETAPKEDSEDVSEPAAETKTETKTASKAVLESAKEKKVERKSKGSKNAKSGTKKETKKPEKTKRCGIESALCERSKCTCFGSVRFTRRRPLE